MFIVSSRDEVRHEFAGLRDDLRHLESRMQQVVVLQVATFVASWAAFVVTLVKALQSA
jgi:hypothetical protein